MFKPMTRPVPVAASQGAGFADTQFLHADDEDYSGFAPTQVAADDEIWRPAAVPARAAVLASRLAALSGPSIAPAQVRPAAPQAEEPAMPPSWITSVPPGISPRETAAHEAAHRARAVIAAQRRLAARPVAAAPARRLPAGFRGLLPLFVGVAVTVALISAVLPLFDRL